jgi:hypothetical protein
MTECLQMARCVCDEEAIDSDFSYSRSTSLSDTVFARLVVPTTRKPKMEKQNGRKFLK